MDSSGSSGAGARRDTSPGVARCSVGRCSSVAPAAGAGVLSSAGLSGAGVFIAHFHDHLRPEDIAHSARLLKRAALRRLRRPGRGRRDGASHLPAAACPLDRLDGPPVGRARRRTRLGQGESPARHGSRPELTLRLVSAASGAGACGRRPSRPSSKCRCDSPRAGLLQGVQPPVEEGGLGAGRVPGQVAQPFTGEDRVLVLPQCLLHVLHRLRRRRRRPCRRSGSPIRRRSGRAWRPCGRRAAAPPAPAPAGVASASSTMPRTSA